MKKYKLLKELPWLEVGTIVSYDNWRCSLYKEEQENLTNLELQSISLIESILVYSSKEETDWLEEIKEEPKSIYELKEWDKFFYIDGDISVYVSYKTEIKWDYSFDILLEYWNVFLTKKEAEKELEKRKALTKINKWIYDNKIELFKTWFTILLRYNSWLEIVEVSSHKWFADIIFKNQENAKKCLKECRESWNILFNLKD